MTNKRRLEATLMLLAAGGIAAAASGIHWAVTFLAFAIIAVQALIEPGVIVAAVVASIPVQSTLAFPVGPGNVTLTQLLLFGLLAGWGVVFWRRRIWLDSIVVGFLLVLAAYAVSLIAVDNPGVWLQETYRWAVAGVFYVICRSVIDGWHATRWCIWGMIAGVIGMAALSTWQLLAGTGYGDATITGSQRVPGTFGTPNPLAAYLEMTVPFLLACLALVGWKGDTLRFTRPEKWLLAVACFSGIVVVLLTQSRGGWIGFALGCVVLWWRLPHRFKAVSAVAATLGIVAFLLTPFDQSQVSRFGELGSEADASITTDSQSSYELGAGRGAVWSTAVQMLEDKPLTGVGAGEFDEKYREYAVSWLHRFPLGQAHNVWLQMGAQAGIWGIAAYTVWFGASLWSIITALRRALTQREQWIITGVLGVLVAYAAHSMVDYLNVLSLGLQLSVLTAIALTDVPEPLSRYRPVTQPLSSSAVPEHAW